MVVTSDSQAPPGPSRASSAMVRAPSPTQGARMRNIRTKLVTGAAIGAAALGGGAIANAATSSTASTPASRSHAAHTVNGKTETALTGTVASKVRAAAL